MWFDSGSSWHAVLEQEPDLAPPADLYFEGGDQYRGWFHTSLLTSVGVGEQHETPFRMVGTAGWTLDEQGRAMSKSLGNGVDPVDIADRLGAEIVRLWVASVDFREDVVSSEQIMQRLAENYRKLRNTFRFLLGNLADFDPARDAVADAKLLPLDRYMLARCRELVEKISGMDGKGGWYGDFQFHRVYHAVNEFSSSISVRFISTCSRTASTPLLRKASNAAPRRQFSGESPKRSSAWSHRFLLSRRMRFGSICPLRRADRPACIWRCFRKRMSSATPIPEFLEDWRKLLNVRDRVLIALEADRKAGKIGKALEARIGIIGDEKLTGLLSSYQGPLKELFNVSQVDLGASRPEPASEELQLALVVSPASGHKCDRCWNYYPDDSPQAVRQFGPWPNVCGRCADALRQMGYSENTQ